MASQKSVDRTPDELSANGGSPRDAAGDVAANVRGAAETVAARLPDAAAQTRAAVDQAARRIESGSDEMLTHGTTLSLGLAIGMLLAGAPRLLVVLALIPAAAMGLTLLDRNGRQGVGGPRRSAG
jgi:hypothetical protein